MRKKYQRKDRKSNHKFEIVRGQELLVRVPLPMAEVWAEMQAKVEELTGQAGLQILRAILENEVTRRVGPPHRPNPSAGCVRGGKQPGYVVFAGQKVSLERPRVRTHEGQEESLLSARITAALKAKEPDWEYIGAIDNRFPIVPSEKRVVVGTWQAPKSRSQDVFVSVYSVENREEAAKWLQPVRDEHVAEGWHVKPFQIGDEGYLSKYKNGDRFDIEFRRGAIVAKTSRK